jgi:hypothetical protein
MKADRTAAVVFLLVSVVFWTQTYGLQYNGFIFPRAILVLVILLSIGLLVQTMTRKGGEQKAFLPANIPYVLVSIAIVALWIFFLNILGFIVSSVLFLSILTVIIDLRKPNPAAVLKVAAVHTALVVVFWITFHVFLLVPLPEGYLI